MYYYGANSYASRTKTILTEDYNAHSGEVMSERFADLATRTQGQLHPFFRAIDLFNLFVVLYWRYKRSFNTLRDILSSVAAFGQASLYIYIIEPRREKTGFLHMRKQRRRSASR